MDIGAGQLHYETIEKRARPARVAVLLDSSDVDWRHTALRIIEFLSSIWGGRHSIIVPTDGTTIAPVFWAILEKFSPDYVFFYAKTGEDIRISRPAEYTDHLEAHIKANENDTVLSDQEKERIDQELRGAWAHHFGLTPGLCSQIADRLVPFHHNKHFEYITGHGYIPYQVTSILDFLPCVDHPRSVSSFQVPAEIEAIWWAAQTGKYSAEVNQGIGSVGLSEERIDISEEDTKTTLFAGSPAVPWLRVRIRSLVQLDANSWMEGARLLLRYRCQASGFTEVPFQVELCRSVSLMSLAIP